MIYSGCSVFWKGMPHSYVYHITSHVDVCVLWTFGGVDRLFVGYFFFFVASVVWKCYVLCTL